MSSCSCCSLLGKKKRSIKRRAFSAEERLLPIYSKIAVGFLSTIQEPHIGVCRVSNHYNLCSSQAISNIQMNGEWGENQKQEESTMLILLYIRDVH